MSDQEETPTIYVSIDVTVKTAKYTYNTPYSKGESSIEAEVPLNVLSEAMFSQQALNNMLFAAIQEMKADIAAKAAAKIESEETK